MILMENAESMLKRTTETSPGRGNIALSDVVNGLALWELWGRMCWSEVRRRYRRTMLGPMWVALSLGIFALVLSLVWSAIFKIDVHEYLPFLLSGMLPWLLISNSVGESCTTFLGAEPLMKSRQFPYTVLINVVVARNVIIFGHNLLTYGLVVLILGVPITAYTLMVVPGFVLLVLNLGWICLLTAILCLRFRDFQQLVTIVLQIAMLITPVLWPVSQLTGRRSILVHANPLYHLVDVVRSPLLGKSVEVESYIACAAMAVIGWWITLWVFNKKRNRLVYWF
jgi:ABC-type polysaccharide/polyol phosphate export permease